MLSCGAVAAGRRTPRVFGLGLAALAAAALCAPPSVAAPSVDGEIGSESTVAPYSFSKQFDIADTSNQQGLAFGGGFLWVCFATGGGEGKIVKYSLSGSAQKTSPNLPLGHCAEIDYRSKDGTIYAVDYNGGSVAQVRVVDMDLAQPTIVKTFDVTRYGLGQMVSIDNARDQMLVKGGSRPYRFNYFALAGTKSATTATWLREVTYAPNLGMPQGLEIVGDDMLFLTTNFANGGIGSNRIHILGLDGAYQTYINVPITRESEGLGIDPRTNNLYLGFHKPNSVYRMSPAYQP